MGRGALKKPVILLVLMLFIILLISNSHFDLRVHASNLPLVYFSKSSYVIGVNRPFNVTIMVANVSDLAAWQVGIVFDTKIMKYVTATAPTDNIYGSRIIFAAGIDEKINSSLLDVGAAALPSDPSFSGSGKLATVTFIMNATGTTALPLDVTDTFLLNSRVDPMLCTATGCLVTAVQYMADVNNDGIVDMRDIMAVIMAFNSFPNTPRWNPYADVDNSGRIDMRDVVLVVANFGMHTSGTPSGGVPGIEKLEFAGFYAETTNDGWIVHVVINNTGSTPIMIDNSTVLLNSYFLSFYQTYVHLNFGQLTLQPGDMTDLQFMLLGGSGSPWHSGLEIYLGIPTASGGWYTTLNYRSLYLP
jgi:hypothetical protein